MNLEKCLEIERTCSLAALRKATRVVTQIYDELLRPLQLHSTQFTLLVALTVAGETTITPLARLLAMDRTTLTRNLDLLVRDGLVLITPGADQRTRVIRLTETGQHKVAQGIPLWEQGQRLVIEQLGRERWTLLLGDLAELVMLAKE